jgi:hypothetical protein
MANKRLITSAIFKDEFFGGTLGMFERCLWIGLFATCADDQGRFVDNPIVIRSDVFPYDDLPVADIEKALVMFANEGKIQRYTVGKKKYIQLLNWWEHQQPQWAMPSPYPAPPGWDDRIRSNIKGKYICINWHTKGSKQANEDEDKLDTPPGDPTWDDKVEGQNPNPDEVLKDIGGKPPKRQSKTSDPRSKHPAILAAKGISGKYPPLEIYDDVIQTLGVSPDGKKLAACRKEWVERGYNPIGWKWLTEWYVSGIPPRGHPGKDNGSIYDQGYTLVGDS